MCLVLCKVLRADGRLVNMSGVFLYKQCTSSLPLFQRYTNKQTHEVDRMLKQFRATVPFFSQMVYETTLGSRRRLNTKRGSCEVWSWVKCVKVDVRMTVCNVWMCFNIRSTSCVCLLVLRWKRGRELVHCLYKKTLEMCLVLFILLYSRKFSSGI